MTSKEGQNMSKTNELFEEHREAVNDLVRARGVIDLGAAVTGEDNADDNEMKALLLGLDGYMVELKVKLGPDVYAAALDDALADFAARSASKSVEVTDALHARWG